MVEFVEVRTFVFILLHVGRDEILYIFILFSSIVYATNGFEDQAQKKKKEDISVNHVRLFVYHISDLF